MKRYSTIAAIVALLVVALVGCTQPGYLEVENETGADIVVEPDGESDETISDGDSETWEWELASSPLGSEELDIDVEVSGWFKNIETIGVTISPGETETLTIDADAGLFVLENRSAYTIDTLGIATSESSAQSRDDDTVGVGGSTAWTLRAGQRWYFFIQDSYGWYNTLYWDVTAGTQSTVLWYGDYWAPGSAGAEAEMTANSAGLVAASGTSSSALESGANKAPNFE